MPFLDTRNKVVIRSAWDLPILQRWHDTTDQPLSYLGLPGPELHDLRDWKAVLGKRTGVESPGRTKQERDDALEIIGTMGTNAQAHGISSGLQILRADIEDVIINAVDIDGNRPQMNDGQPAHLAHFNYDIVNLDFDGGLGYRSRGHVRRVNALKKLFERQEGHNFILLLTVNIRDTLRDELDEYIRGLRTRNAGTSCERTLNWYLARGKGEREYKLKVTVPSFIHAIAEMRMYKSVCWPPIVYDGYHARLVHFVFELTAQPGTLRCWSEQDDRALVELPLLRSVDGQLRLAPMHPEFDMMRFRGELLFLPDSTISSILAAITPR